MLLKRTCLLGFGMVRSVLNIQMNSNEWNADGLGCQVHGVVPWAVCCGRDCFLHILLEHYDYLFVNREFISNIHFCANAPTSHRLQFGRYQLSEAPCVMPQLPWQLVTALVFVAAAISASPASVRA